jgi:4-hydroxy-2-oxoheptanedioate aldolase
MIKLDQAPRSWLAQRAIGAGFQSVLFADCRTVEDVQECVRVTRPDTPEDGGTFGCTSRRMSYGDYGGEWNYVQALRDVVVAIMVEKKGVVENLEEVLSVPGVDMTQWGPADYCMSIGRPGDWYHPDIKAVERKVIETSIKMGVPPRIEINSADAARYYLDLGVRHFCVGTDLPILSNWMKKNGDEMRKVLEGH